jgi:PIN domain nuclease of toxin-antitoxin system
VRLLLDTHVALWAITDSPSLQQKTRELIESARVDVWVSVASIWEVAIKHSLGRGDMPISGKQALHYFGVSGYRILSIEPEHAAAVEDLPMYHADPFDRLIVAQALMEPMRLITHDRILPRYSDSIIQI